MRRGLGKEVSRHIGSEQHALVCDPCDFEACRERFGAQLAAVLFSNDQFKHLNKSAFRSATDAIENEKSLNNVSAKQA
jgi:hypothetical protein